MLNKRNVVVFSTSSWIIAFREVVWQIVRSLSSSEVAFGDELSTSFLLDSVSQLSSYSTLDLRSQVQDEP